MKKDEIIEIIISLNLQIQKGIKVVLNVFLDHCTW